MSQSYLQAHCQSRTSQCTDQSFVKELANPTQEKIELKKIFSPSENKKYPTAQPDTTKTMKRSIDNGLQTRWTEGQLITGVWQKWRLSTPQTHLWLIKHWFSASTFVVKIATSPSAKPLTTHLNY
jgi:hypothetical protein